MNTFNNSTNDRFYQHTLKDSFHCIGKGLHTGLKVITWVLPAEPDTGIIFVRHDIDSQYSEIKANWKNVHDTHLSTTIANSYSIRVSTVEHILAALYSCGIDNARILVDRPEVPILDGSAAPFVELISSVGKQKQNKERRAVKIKQPIFVSEKNKMASFLPAYSSSIELEIDFDSKAIGKQHFFAPMDETFFKNEIAPARTFGFKEQLDTLHKLGLAQGGSMDNAILVDGDKVENKEGLRFKNEFVRHKVLDCIGDLALIGAPIFGKFSASCTGHHLNNLLLHKLMANKHSWEYTTVREYYSKQHQVIQFPNNAEQMKQNKRSWKV